MLKVLQSTSFILLQEALAALIRAYPQTETMVSDIDGLSEPWPVWTQEALSVALDGRQKIAVIHQPYFLMKGSLKPNITPLPDLAGLTDWLAKIPSDSIVIFAIHGEIDGRLELSKAIKKYGDITTLTIPDMESWSQDIVTRLKSVNTTITFDAVKTLVQATYPDYDRLIAELDKIATFSPTLTQQDIVALVKPSLEDNVFQLTNDLFGSTPYQALVTFRAFKVQKEEPMMFIHVLTRHFLLQAQVLYLLGQHQTTQTIAQQLAIHPYRVTLMAKQQKKLSLKVTNTILRYLGEVDLKIKSGSPDRYSDFEWFLLKVIKIIS
jgi:DNA polymerase-3 subunit delta